MVVVVVVSWSTHWLILLIAHGSQNQASKKKKKLRTVNNTTAVCCMHVIIHSHVKKDYTTRASAKLANLEIGEEVIARLARHVNDVIVLLGLVVDLAGLPHHNGGVHVNRVGRVLHTKWEII